MSSTIAFQGRRVARRRLTPWYLIAVMITLPGVAEPLTLTRYLAHVDVSDGPLTAEFAAQSGPATLVLDMAPGATRVVVELNGESVVDRRVGASGDSATEFEVSVELAASNDIRARVQGDDSARVALRVRQAANVELNVVSRVHFNTNVSDFESARAFYGMLGFETVSGFPDANTVAMAEAIGVDTPTEYDGSQGGEPGGYLLHGELIGAGGFGGGVIDLIEFTIPRNDDPPYAALNHLGMVSASMTTENLDADYARLRERGVDFLSEPVDGRWVMFRDPDGTFYRLEAVHADGPTPNEAGTHIVGLGAVTINVSDLERSRAWYRMLGYEVFNRWPDYASDAEALGLGFDQPIRWAGESTRHRGDGSLIELVQWLEPFDPTPPYPLPVNHIGIHRMAFLTTDIEADVAALQAQGVELISPITPCCSGPDSLGSIVAFYDPDGVVVELVEQPVMGSVVAFMQWLGRLFD